MFAADLEIVGWYFLLLLPPFAALASRQREQTNIWNNAFMRFPFPFLFDKFLMNPFWHGGNTICRNMQSPSGVAWRGVVWEDLREKANHWLLTCRSCIILAHNKSMATTSRADVSGHWFKASYLMVSQLTRCHLSRVALLGLCLTKIESHRESGDYWWASIHTNQPTNIRQTQSNSSSGRSRASVTYTARARDQLAHFWGGPPPTQPDSTRLSMIEQNLAPFFSTLISKFKVRLAIWDDDPTTIPASRTELMMRRTES